MLHKIRPQTSAKLLILYCKQVSIYVPINVVSTSQVLSRYYQQGTRCFTHKLQCLGNIYGCQRVNMGLHPFSLPGQTKATAILAAVQHPHYLHAYSFPVKETTSSLKTCTTIVCVWGLVGGRCILYTRKYSSEVLKAAYQKWGLQNDAKCNIRIGQWQYILRGSIFYHYTSSLPFLSSPSGYICQAYLVPPHPRQKPLHGPFSSPYKTKRGETDGKACICCPTGDRKDTSNY